MKSTGRTATKGRMGMIATVVGLVLMGVVPESQANVFGDFYDWGADWASDVGDAAMCVADDVSEFGSDAVDVAGDAAGQALRYASPLNVLAAVPYVESAVVTSAGAVSDAAGSVAAAAVVAADATADAAVVVAQTVAPVVVPVACAIADIAEIAASGVAGAAVVVAGTTADAATAIARVVAPVVVPIARTTVDGAVCGATAVADAAVWFAEAVSDVATSTAKTVADTAAVVADATSDVARTVATMASPVVVPAAEAVADAAIDMWQTVGDAAVVVADTLDPVVVPVAGAVADAATATGEAVADGAFAAAEAVSTSATAAFNAVKDGAADLGRRLHDPLADLGTAIWEAHPEATRRGTIRFLELVDAGATAVGDATLWVGQQIFEHRRLVLGIAIPTACLALTEGAGSYWCIAAGAAIMGAENAVTQYTSTGTVSAWDLAVASGDGVLSGAFGTPLFGTPLRAGAALLGGAERTGSIAGDLALSRAVNTSSWVGSVRTLLGGVRDSKQFWRKQLERFAADFSVANRARIAEGLSPVLDARYAFRNPEYLPRYIGNMVRGTPAEELIHHHVQGGALAVPMPENLHWAKGAVCDHHQYLPFCI